MSVLLLLYAFLAVTTLLTWVPLAARFYKFWLIRKNPESLAICAIVILLCWEICARIWAIAELVDHGVVETVLTAASLFVGIFFHVAVYWTKKKFPARKE